MSERDETTKAPRHLPDFRSREDLAEFWDTHSFTDYLSDLEPGKAHIAEDVTAPLSEITQVRFDKAADRQLAAYARQRGIRKSTLSRMIAIEWLRTPGYYRRQASVRLRSDSTPSASVTSAVPAITAASRA